MATEEQKSTLPKYDLNYLTMCRRVQVVPGSLHADQWPFIVNLLTANGSFPSDAHASHTPSIERTENSIYAYAIVCSRLDDNMFMPNFVERIHSFFLPIFLIAGIIGNALTTSIMMRLGQSHMSVCLYAALLAVLDCLMLVLPAGDMWIHVTFGFRALNTMLTYSNAFCNTYPFLFNFCVHLRAFVHLTIAVDIMLLHWRPIHYGQTMNARRVRTVLLIYLVLLLIINSQFLWTYDIRSVTSQDSIPKGNYCTYSVKWVDIQFRDIAWPVIDFSLGEAFPFFVVTLSTIISLFLCWRSRPPSINSMHRYIVDVSTFTQMRTTFICLNTLFICSVIPEIVFYALKYRAFTDRHELQRQIAYSNIQAQLKGILNKDGDRHSHFMPYMMNSFVVPELLIVYMKFAIASCKFWLYFACSSYFRRHSLSKLKFKCQQCRKTQPSTVQHNNSNNILRQNVNRSHTGISPEDSIPTTSKTDVRYDRFDGIGNHEAPFLTYDFQTMNHIP